MNAIRINLKLFCADDRPALALPWTQGEWTYASDGRIIIRVPKVDGIENNPDTATPAHAAKLFDERPPRMLWIAVPTLPEPVMVECNHCGGVGREAIKCKECNGEGRVECCECGQDRDCPECDGEGWLGNTEETCLLCNGTGKMPDRKQKMAIGGTWFACHYLRLIRDNLPEVELSVRPEPAAAAIRFAGGGEGLLMPMRVNT